MEYQALYRKYRPQKFSDVVDQESILRILTNSLKEGHISHAYLFSGPRGTGKTTIAKLVAKTVNCLNLQDDFSICGKCENCLDILNNSPDIIEIDAASNNGVDEIRELKSKINLVPSKLKYKVYIIDEVHMLSISAFNALLKTLEEPPSHVIFILATTEFYKVPETIVSRCQCLNFTRIKTSSIAKRLKEISELENIKIEDTAISAIAEYSAGGMRDALGMLDKLSSYNLDTITEEDFLQINGLISKKDIDCFIDAILNKDNKQVIDTLNKFEELGYDFSKLLEKMMEECRDLMIGYYLGNRKEKLDVKELYQLIICFNDIYNSLKEASNRKIIVEVNLLKYMNFQENPKNDVTQMKRDEMKLDSLSSKTLESREKKEQISREIKSFTKDLDNEKKIKEEGMKNKSYKIDLQVKKQRINNTFAMASKVLKNMALEKWKKLDDYIISNDYSYQAGLLKDVNIAVVSNKNLILTSKFDSVIDTIYQNFDKISELIDLIMENSYQVVLLTDTEFKGEVSVYKEHMNDTNYYEYKEEEKPFLIFSEEIEKKEDVGYTSLVQKAIDVFGQEKVEIE